MLVKNNVESVAAALTFSCVDSNTLLGIHVVSAICNITLGRLHTVDTLSVANNISVFNTTGMTVVEAHTSCSIAEENLAENFREVRGGVVAAVVAVVPEWEIAVGGMLL